jgi:hypothetical protein
MRGYLVLHLYAPDGTLLEARRAHNAVLQNGGTLVAQLFAGQLAGGITHMGVGTSDAPESDRFATVALANPDGDDALRGGTEVAITPDQVSVQPPDDTTRTVKVRIRGTLPAATAVGTIREAGLLSRAAAPGAPPDGPPAAAVLYNRVVFPPLTKRNDHDLTLFWEVTFPYGDLQELL